MARDRELIDPEEDDEPYLRRDERGRFDDDEDVGRSLTEDKKRSAKSASKKGRGGGDRKSSRKSDQ